MQTIFVMVKCELGKAYEVADDACGQPRRAKRKAAEAAFPGQCHQASGLEVYRRVLTAFALDFVADLLALVEAG